ncbi:carboxypeptidase-like regulatory domain-containing protein [Aureisphaera galaxeae]|uniref:carboxypeptidase-like regulatory domain-containing protein n=1 Tax=Aureisphaera galaxeae TaxID=1538023 RepID=UPI002350AA79|nr:carboxypeptidase-like regulatory domain-containing protein [Aureisphaera galaxeae]MDC8004645.1 carboxypeptidase-like regulatory domain-containing protein [Aureisphaera galaxeae]
MKMANRFLNNFKIGLFGMLFCFVLPLQAQETFKEFHGKVFDTETNDVLVFANVGLKGTNVSTITNAEGEFTLKISSDVTADKVIVSSLGYQSVELALTELEKGFAKIKLSPMVTELSEVNLTAYSSAEALVRAVFADKAKNNLREDVLMTAFYRETIKKRKRNVSLTEAVINLYKQPNASVKKDVLELHKARKSTDYKRLDTVALKLQGGPFSVLYIDVMKYPEYIFTDRSIGYYDFTFAAPSTVNDKPVYVVRFRQKEEIPPPGYEGKLFIDAETLALTSASYSLIIGNEREASEMFVKRKPRDVNVIPTRASYRVDYREKNGKWYYGYGSVQLAFKVSKRRKWFNSHYSLSSEMAVTDWETNPTGKVALIKDRLKPTVIIADAVSGFSDPEFWGPYNVIEPEKSIESAINKIRRKLKKEKGS